MSRLDRFIERMVSQRASIDFALAETAGLGGPILELGLGNGRTYDHLREKAGPETIYVFERAVAANPLSIPEDEMLILGEVTETLPQAFARFGATARLVHSDLGAGNAQENLKFSRAISPLIEPLVAPGGIVIANDPMYFDTLEPLPLPEGAIRDRSFLYRRPA
ncbi:class I SAM-dependent methyltransferase [Pseudooceanicola sp. 502str34]|uniref:class I SAM-dependent methyltransferase n=1 Tax=Maritimibacter alkaliphilus TaxID=404236 RepID=UPI001C9569C6|nr:class I SAM-dependent methyltransferase [Maritimibacter alkaliphilus]MBY6091935.1 class I SAM-dependent methyltransferase [Maritimibacter alkaliphilus]